MAAAMARFDLTAALGGFSQWNLMRFPLASVTVRPREPSYHGQTARAARNFSATPIRPSSASTEDCVRAALNWQVFG